ncbi:glycosyltransferase family 8 protein [Helicobacter ibis]|uniref:Glycosyltransferase family 8 protein n=1 Tax=Helicobacter ibis TaxID=2962633 RepID=A0ABT4VFF9_9HELI|nr:glycosyltransferase family 8 protein [Helicobacter ibis]MDA3969435.1 glycosyltransferase family 8 protein [Helicobacter ibis]
MYHIVLNSDESYMKYAAVLISSIAKNSPHDNGYMIHILTNEISKEISDKMELLTNSLSKYCKISIKLHHMGDKDFQGSPLWGENQNYLAYYRLKLAQVIPADIDRCLYLDVDMLVVGDISCLFEVDLGEAIAGVVLDFYRPQNKRPLALKRQKLSYVTLDTNIYFNSGLLLVNLKQWREHKVEETCIEFLSNYESMFPDQDALNVVIKDKTKILSPKFNYYLLLPSNKLVFRGKNNANINEEESVYNEALKDIRIVHFIGHLKPWDSFVEPFYNYGHLVATPYIRQWWSIALRCEAFRDELLDIYENREQEKLDILARDIYLKMKKLEYKINSTRHPIRTLIKKLKGEL